MRDFEEFFGSRAKPMRRMAFGLVGDWDRAEDLTQTTFVRLYRNWHRPDPLPALPSTHYCTTHMGDGKCRPQ